MSNSTKTIQITVTEDNNTNEKSDHIVVLNLVSQASEIIEVMLQTNSLESHPDSNEDMLNEVSHLLFDALLHLTPSDELTSFPRKF